MAEQGYHPVNPPNPARKKPHADDLIAYRYLTGVERFCCRLDHLPRIRTRYDNRANSLLFAVPIAAAII